ncbi:NAD(P)/FAD-dependent oxidoreductase [Candidatus Methylacidiphilum infernorum]|uniref:NAD(P)/FAD-dependent oxidoreductase n=1 Tax=Candidatus Methylacidiphilum infernorum TaxID=511746 RepID=A0ABX7PUX1_9BACT|nr:nitrite reductase large subunit NirB [Candidatus Methylacidiphilum infernorum]QSR86795.1 NAD(P)/FAD-dependent oxidoreductase [Candidatus Methylacidiphilum infernorum]
MKKEKLVVIGAGMAAVRFLDELVERGGTQKYDITLIGKETRVGYNRILLSSLLAGEIDFSSLELKSPEWFSKQGISVRAGCEALLIDTVNRKVWTDKEKIPYDKLFIATGSTPFIPPLSGLYDSHNNRLDGVFCFREIKDCQAILKQIHGAEQAVVIGGGLLGIEAAYGLYKKGMQTVLVHLMGHLMEKQLDSLAAALLKRELEKLGIRILLRTKTTRLQKIGRRIRIEFENGNEIAADIVVIATGIVPNCSLAKKSGIAVNKGIIVNSQMESVSHPGIFAAGECIEFEGQTYGLVNAAWQQASIAARSLLDPTWRSSYTGTLPIARLKVAGIDLLSFGQIEPTGNEDIVLYTHSQQAVYRKLFIKDKKLTGGIFLGPSHRSLEALHFYEKNLPLNCDPQEFLFEAPTKTREEAIEDKPDDFQVCNCNGVTKREILESIKKGCSTLKEVMTISRAATGCGSCKPLVQRLWGKTAKEPAAEDPTVHYYVPSIPLTKRELIEEIKKRDLRRVSAVFAALAGGKEDAQSKPALASLLKMVWGKDYKEEPDSRFVNDRVHANIQKDGTYSVVPRMYGGITTAEQLRKIADVAEKYQVGMIKLTGGQRIDLLGVKKEQLPAIWKELGMSCGHAYTKAFRTCKSCVGTDFCRFGVGDSTALAIAIEKKFQGIESPAKMKLAVSGCSRNCAEATTKDIGVVAIGTGWEIYVGGAAGSKVRAGDLLVVAKDQPEVLRLIGRFIQYYRENAKYAERSYSFVERLGIEHVRKAVVFPSEEEARRLDREIEQAIEAYIDPWQAAQQEQYPHQFESSSPIPGSFANQ